MLAGLELRDNFVAVLSVMMIGSKTKFKKIRDSMKKQMKEDDRNQMNENQRKSD